jgi:hypothetical protein
MERKVSQSTLPARPATSSIIIRRSSLEMCSCAGGGGRAGSYHVAYPTSIMYACIIY